MASGIEMMIKAMGIDPNVIQQSIGQFQQTMIAFKQQMDRIEQRLEELTGELKNVKRENYREGGS